MAERTIAIRPSPSSGRDARMKQRHDSLTNTIRVCPNDLVTRRELALLLEELGEIEGALFHWRGILDIDQNNLEAWEGLARCRGKLPAARRRE